MRDRLTEIRDLGAELVVVGNGKPHHAADFRAERGLDFPLLVDPELKAYAAAGLKRSVLSSFNLRSMGNAARALKNGYYQGLTKGDPWQQGGTFVVEAGGRVLYEHVSREAGDHPALDDVLAALRKAA